MSIGKTKYTLQFYTYPNQVNQIVLDWLNQSYFKRDYGTDNTWSCISFDPMSGNRGFQYSIDGNNLTLFAWIIGSDNKTYTLDAPEVYNTARDEYKNLITGLINKINEANAAYQQQLPNAMQPDPNSQQYYPLQYVPAVEANHNKQKEMLCMIGFALSIAGLLMSFAGFCYGIVIYCLDIYFAIQGLKTKKKGFAIATIVMTILSIIIVIFEVIILILLEMI